MGGNSLPCSCRFKVKCRSPNLTDPIKIVCVINFVSILLLIKVVANEIVAMLCDFSEASWELIDAFGSFAPFVHVRKRIWFLRTLQRFGPTWEKSQSCDKMRNKCNEIKHLINDFFACVAPGFKSQFYFLRLLKANSPLYWVEFLKPFFSELV